MQNKNMLFAFYGLIFWFLIVPQSATGDFYVIPVGSKTILPSDIVTLSVGLTPGMTDELRISKPDGSSGGEFIVPDGKVYVMTSLTISPTAPVNGLNTVQILHSKDNYNMSRLYFSSPHDRSSHYTFTPGYIVPSGFKLKVNSLDNSDGWILVYVNGFLAPDK